MQQLSFRTPGAMLSSRVGTLRVDLIESEDISSPGLDLESTAMRRP